MLGFEKRRAEKARTENRISGLERRLEELEKAHDEVVTDLAHHLGIAVSGEDAVGSGFFLRHWGPVCFEHEGRRVKMEYRSPLKKGAAE